MHGAHQVAQIFSRTGVPKKAARSSSLPLWSLNVIEAIDLGEECHCSCWMAVGGERDQVKLSVGLDWVSQKATIAAIEDNINIKSVVLCLMAPYGITVDVGS